MSSRSSSSGSSSRRSGDYRELRIPDTFAVKSLIWFCGRDPRKAKSVRRYYDEDFDARSTGSGASMFSWSSAASQVYLVETTNPYWYWGEESETASYSSSRRKSSKRGRTSRASQRSNPTGTWGGRRATVEDDDDDDDDTSSEGSFEDYGGAGPGPAPFPHPGMMPPQGPPPGAFQTVYGMYPQHASPHPGPPNGYPVPPPPRPATAGMPPPPPPGGHFVTDSSGIQVFMDG